jgi:uncharacterized protein YndB with AHSA1/START domain
MTDHSASKPAFIYVTYIASTPEKVWQALTDPEITPKYWFGYRVAANGKTGDAMTAISPKGKEAHRDVILESDPPRRLSYSWRPLYRGMRDERQSRVTFTIEPFKVQVRLTMVHDDFDEGSKVYEAIKGGWPAVLSSLKSFLETGHGLESTWSDEDRKRVAELEVDA